MKHFYKLLEGNMQGALVNAIVQQQSEFSLTGVEGIAEMQVFGLEADGMVRAGRGAASMPALRRLSLAVLQMTDGVQLGNCFLLRISSKATLDLGMPVPEFSGYAMLLHAASGAMVLAGDEAVQVRSGDLWWVDRKAGASLINKSDDDVFMLLVEVRNDGFPA